MIRDIGVILGKYLTQADRLPVLVEAAGFDAELPHHPQQQHRPAYPLGSSSVTTIHERPSGLHRADPVPSLGFLGAGRQGRTRTGT